MSVDTLGLSPALLRALADLGFSTPTPIQTAAIPPALAGHDLLAAAQTGTGKTAAFGLPLLQRLGARGAAQSAPRALVLTPTRELALQVHDNLRGFARHIGLRTTAVFGGAGMTPQVDTLRRGVDVLVATPGRLIDHMDRRSVSLANIEVLVLDEADRMLDMGFQPAIRRILGKLPAERQTLLFSATFEPAVKQLARDLMRDPQEISVTPPNAVANTVSHRVHPVDKSRKRDLLIAVLEHTPGQQTLVFSRTKHGADRLAQQLERAGIRAAAIHGDKRQSARVRALDDFKSGRSQVLVATDVAARGIDIQQLPVVINFDLPNAAEDYVHRIGRTGRAGSSGEAISLVCAEESEQLRAIQKLLKADLAIEPLAGFEPTAPLQLTAPSAPARRAAPRRGGGGQRTGARSHAGGGRGHGGGQSAPRSGTRPD